MAPSEESILSNFLLSPASLPSAMSLEQFTEMFPKRLRSNPQIRSLYRELQQLREQDMDLINQNIDQESKQGEQQKAELQNALKQAGVDGQSKDDQREMDLDTQMLGQSSSSSADDFHSVASLLSAMESACDTIEQEIDHVDKSASTLLEALNATVGDLSDLRYGKMQGPAGDANEVVDEAIKGLKNLEDKCSRE